MIDAGPSLRAAEGLSAPAVAMYLLTKGWKARPSRVEGVSILSIQPHGADEPIQLLLPVLPGFTDETRRVADALRTIAALEERSEDSIASDVRRMYGDERGMGYASLPIVASPDPGHTLVHATSLADVARLQTESAKAYFDSAKKITEQLDYFVKQATKLGEQFAEMAASSRQAGESAELQERSRHSTKTKDRPLPKR